MVGGGGSGSGGNTAQNISGSATGTGGASGGEVLIVDNFKLELGIYTVTIGPGGQPTAVSFNSPGFDGSYTTFSDSTKTIFAAAGGKGGQIVYAAANDFNGALGLSEYPILNANSLTSSGGGGIVTATTGTFQNTNPSGIGKSITYGSAITPYVNKQNSPAFTPNYYPGPVIWSYANNGGNCDGSGNAGGGGGAGGPGSNGYYSSTYNLGGNGGSELFVYFTSSSTPVTTTTNNVVGGIGGGAGGWGLYTGSSTSAPGSSGGNNTGISTSTSSGVPGNPGTGCAGGNGSPSITSIGGAGGSGRLIIRFQSYS